MNLLNDRRYVASGTRKKHVPAERLVKKRSNFSRSVIVSLAVSSLGSTELLFVEPSTKVDGMYYRDVLLTQHLLPAIKWMSGGHFIFQQLLSTPSTRNNCFTFSRDTRFHTTMVMATEQPWSESSGLSRVEHTGAASVSHTHSWHQSPQDTSGCRVADVDFMDSYR